MGSIKRQDLLSKLKVWGPWEWGEGRKTEEWTKKLLNKNNNRKNIYMYEYVIMKPIVHH